MWFCYCSCRLLFGVVVGCCVLLLCGGAGRCVSLFVACRALLIFVWHCVLVVVCSLSRSGVRWLLVVVCCLLSLLSIVVWICLRL